MQSAALTAAAIPIAYAAWDVEPPDLATVLGFFTTENVAGNVTVPHKQAASRLCGRLTAVARVVGAVNTFWVEDGVLVGDNTDVGGFHNAVVRLRGAVPARTRIALLGGGGAAAAVLAAAAGWPRCEVRLWNRTHERAVALAARFPGVATPVRSALDALAGASLVVHATSIGMMNDEMPIDPFLIPSGADVIDLVYRPGETAWVRAARAEGHRACDGLPMLVEQGALAFERWFGQPPDRAAMWRAVGDAPAGASRPLGRR